MSDTGREQVRLAEIRDDAYAKMANKIVEAMSIADLESWVYESVIDGLMDRGDADLAVEWERLFNALPFPLEELLT